MSESGTPALYCLGGSFFIGPDPARDGVQCVALAKTRKRCRRWVEYGQTSFFETLQTVRGDVDFYNVTQDSRRWREQHCTVHDGSDAEDFCSPEWEPFDAEAAPESLFGSRPAPAW
ncbi:hypothetical protein GXW82_43650 [Streptacidiphilus sp. 4-A2]|nr:hypothetical protein [Streptacidiphilus sp. 4-A2]